MKSIEYGEDLKGNFFQLVHDLCAHDIAVTNEKSQHYQWVADRGIFAGYLALNPAILKWSPHKGSFVVQSFQALFDDGDVKIEMKRQNSQEPVGSLHDPFISYYFDEARELFDGHAHEVCLEQAQQLAEATAYEKTPLVRARSLSGEVVIS